MGRRPVVVRPDRRAWGRLLCRARRINFAEATRGGWLVLAPHPDDETLGAGGLIATLAAAGAEVVVAFVTDGASSHVGAPGWTPRRVADTRAREARAALGALGSTARPLHLGWRDAAPPPRDGAAWAHTVRRLVGLCRRRRLRHVVASWAADPHCDHEATALLARDVAERLRVAPRFYGVWGWTRADVDRHGARMRATALATPRIRGRTRRALDRHGTQLGGRIAGASERFVLPRPMRRLVDLPFALLLEERDAT